MAKLHDLIEGYDAMTDDEKRSAIEALDIPDAPDLSQYVKKSVFDKTASELAAAKKTLAENMSAEEAAKAAKEAAEAANAEQRAALERENAILKTEKELLAKGYSPALAAEVAAAMADNDTMKIIEGMAKHDAEREKAIRADMTRNNPKPQGGKSDDDETDDALEMAKALGKKASDRAKTSETVLGHYLKR